MTPPHPQVQPKPLSSRPLNAQTWSSVSKIWAEKRLASIKFSHRNSLYHNVGHGKAEKPMGRQRIWSIPTPTFQVLGPIISNCSLLSDHRQWRVPPNLQAVCRCNNCTPNGCHGCMQGICLVVCTIYLSNETWFHKVWSTPRTFILQALKRGNTMEPSCLLRSHSQGSHKVGAVLLPWVSHCQSVICGGAPWWLAFVWRVHYRYYRYVLGTLNILAQLIYILSILIYIYILRTFHNLYIGNPHPYCSLAPNGEGWR